MIEAGILLAVVLLLVVLGVMGWRRLAGPPRRRRFLAGRIVVVALVVVPLVLFGTYRLMNARRIQLFGEIIPRVSTTRPVVALTFDDGPQAPYTQELLAVLRERGAKATFFVIGSNLETHPALAAAAVRDGHELGNHSYSHKRMVFKSRRFIRREIERTDDLIRRAGQSGDIHFRSPYGKKLLLLPLHLASAGKKNIFVDVEPDSDPDVAASAHRIVQHVLARAKPGSIILLHAENRRRAESFHAVAGIVDGLKARGYDLVTISELLAAGE